MLREALKISEIFGNWIVIHFLFDKLPSDTNLEWVKLEPRHESVHNEKKIYVWHWPPSFAYISTRCPSFIMARVAGHRNLDRRPCKLVN